MRSGGSSPTYRALLDIREGEELFWDYGQEPLVVGWQTLGR